MTNYLAVHSEMTRKTAIRRNSESKHAEKEPRDTEATTKRARQNLFKNIYWYSKLRSCAEPDRTHSSTWSSRDHQLKTAAKVQASRILHRTIITQHKNFYYFYLFMYDCKTVVFIMIYNSIETTFASIELAFGFDRMNPRSKQPSIELTRYSPVIIEVTQHVRCLEAWCLS